MTGGHGPCAHGSAADAECASSADSEGADASDAGSRCVVLDSVIFETVSQSTVEEACLCINVSSFSPLDMGVFRALLGSMQSGSVRHPGYLNCAPASRYVSLSASLWHAAVRSVFGMGN